MLMAVDCIIFGFDGADLKLLLIKRGFEPEKGRWSLMGGFVQPKETLEQAAARVLKELTGLEDVYMEQLHAFSEVERDPIERTISVTYTSLIDINKYKKQMNSDFHSEWFPLKKLPSLIFDHRDMVEMAKRSDVALAFEATVPDEQGKATGTIGRRSSTSWQLDVKGKQGHSSGIFIQALRISQIPPMISAQRASLPALIGASR